MAKSKLAEARKIYSGRGFFWADETDLVSAVLDAGYTVRAAGRGEVAYVVEWQSRRVDAGLYESGDVSCHVLALCRSSLQMV